MDRTRRYGFSSGNVSGFRVYLRINVSRIPNVFLSAHVTTLSAASRERKHRLAVGKDSVNVVILSVNSFPVFRKNRIAPSSETPRHAASVGVFTAKPRRNRLVNWNVFLVHT
jgi:hypothetical protein